MILLDEIEKAHRDVFNVLLQVLDDGRLTDGQAHRRLPEHRDHHDVEPREPGDRPARREWRRGPMRRAVMDVLKAQLLPEFLNRIDETIIFHPLGMKELVKVVAIQVRRLQKQLSEAGLTIQVSEKAEQQIADEGFDPTYRARPEAGDPATDRQPAGELAAPQPGEVGDDDRRRLGRGRLHVHAG